MSAFGEIVNRLVQLAPVHPLGVGTGREAPIQAIPVRAVGELRVNRVEFLVDWQQLVAVGDVNYRAIGGGFGEDVNFLDGDARQPDGVLPLRGGKPIRERPKRQRPQGESGEFEKIAA